MVRHCHSPQTEEPMSPVSPPEGGTKEPQSTTSPTDSGVDSLYSSDDNDIDAPCDRPRVLLCGASTQGLGLAGQFIQQGCDVSLIDRSPEKLEAMATQDNSVTLTGTMNGKYKFTNIDSVESKWSDLVADREVVVITEAASGHMYYVNRLLLNLMPRAHLVLAPGQLNSALRIRALLSKFGRKDVAVTAVESSVVSVSMRGAAAVNIGTSPAYLSFCTMPARRVDEACALFSHIRSVKKDVMFKRTVPVTVRNFHGRRVRLAWYSHSD